MSKKFFLVVAFLISISCGALVGVGTACRIGLTDPLARTLLSGGLFCFVAAANTDGFKDLGNLLSLSMHEYTPLAWLKKMADFVSHNKILTVAAVATVLNSMLLCNGIYRARMRRRLGLLNGERSGRYLIVQPIFGLAPGVYLVQIQVQHD